MARVGCSGRRLPTDDEAMLSAFPEKENANPPGWRWTRSTVVVATPACRKKELRIFASKVGDGRLISLHCVPGIQLARSEPTGNPRFSEFHFKVKK